MTRSSFLLPIALAAATPGAQAANAYFQRGDSNLDRALDISDPTHTLGFLFLGRPESVGCLDAADSNDDGTVNVADAIHSLGFLFLGSAPPPPPFLECGLDPSPDELGCETFPGCDDAPRFGEPVSYAAYCLPTSAAFADFDGDQALDLAHANWCDGVSIRPGVGDGTFAGAVNHGAGFRPRSVAIADLDSDGALDLAVASEGTPDIPAVSVLLGMGDGSLGEAVHHGVTLGGLCMVHGDLDSNGALDLAVGTYGGHVSILLGAGDGTFVEGTGHDVAGGPVFSVAAGDLDRDGALDLAAADTVGGNVSILPGAGDGTFGEVGRAEVARPVSIALGDLDGDADLDLAVTNAGVSILLGAGDGTFGEPVHCDAGESPASIVAGDVDGDGVLDLAVANRESDDVSILLGAGDGTFGEAVSHAAGDGPRSVALGDANGDGAQDLAVANFDGNDISILLGR